MKRRANRSESKPSGFLGGIDFLEDLSQLSSEELDILTQLLAQKSEVKSGSKREHHHPIREDGPVIIFTWGDLHIGSNATDMKSIDDLQRKILNTPNAYLILLGD